MNQNIDKIAIIGAGALGAVYGSLLFAADPGSVCFLATGERRERLKDGVVVNGRRFEIPVVEPEQAIPVQLLVVAVKHRELDRAIEDMRRAVGPDTVILSVMNGIDSEERIGAAFGAQKVLYALSLGIDAVREDSGVSYANLGRILFGERENETPSPRVRQIGDLFRRAGIAFEVPRDMIRSLWFKYMINVGVNQVSALLGMSYGTLRESTRACKLMDAAMREVIAVAVAQGVDLAERDLEEWYRVLATLSASGRTSMLQDIEAGRATEVDMLAGTVIELGERSGVPTPVNRRLYDELKAIGSESGADGRGRPEGATAKDGRSLEGGGMIGRTTAFILELDRLKQVTRKSRSKGSDRYENSAEHSWHAAMMAYALEPYAATPVDMNRVVGMLLVHDVGEIDTGDTIVYATEGWEEHKAAELEAVQRIFGMVQEPQRSFFLELWHEFEEAATPEARFAHAADRAIPVLMNLANAGQSWCENGIGYERVVSRVGPPIEEGCPALWEYLQKRLAEENEKGWFGEGKG